MRVHGASRSGLLRRLRLNCLGVKTSTAGEAGSPVNGGATSLDGASSVSAGATFVSVRAN